LEGISQDPQNEILALGFCPGVIGYIEGLEERIFPNF